eukprot:GHVQ01039416.1.p2 GENE.GHVQ01039416.1~~GHVQ01039416.1.p2  ORF type:complete len:122 (+),score=6.59 GHVQ01039416.1:239-604(+)
MSGCVCVRVCIHTRVHIYASLTCVFVWLSQLHQLSQSVRFYNQPLRDAFDNALTLAEVPFATSPAYGRLNPLMGAPLPPPLVIPQPSLTRLLFHRQMMQIYIVCLLPVCSLSIVQYAASYR